jgi:predicted helicase
MVGSQYFPLYVYDDLQSRVAETASSQSSQSSLFDGSGDSSAAMARQRRDAITVEGLAHFQSAYPNEPLSREDVFYYVYGMLHSPDYRERFVDNLGKELPRIPRVRSAADFLAFSKTGRALAELHLNYETVPTYAGAKIDSGGKQLADADYRVEKMRFGKSGKDKDRTTIHYNAKITVTGIPLEAYDYVVNGKPAIEWVMERQCVKTDKDSGIVNDANDWAIETMGNPRYPLELLLRVVTVSLETMKIVRSLPALDIREDG